jgi:hypothetical protein
MQRTNYNGMYPMALKLLVLVTAASLETSRAWSNHALIDSHRALKPPHSARGSGITMMFDGIASRVSSAVKVVW